MARRVEPRQGPRISREKRTIAAMVRLYCQSHHGAHGPCQACLELLSYAECRLDRCPFAEHKPTCLNCPIHCYKPQLREQVRQVMRYAGPRMLWHHPILAIRHLLDGRRERNLHRLGNEAP